MYVSCIVLFNEVARVVPVDNRNGIVSSESCIDQEALSCRSLRCRSTNSKRLSTWLSGHNPNECAHRGHHGFPPHRNNSWDGCSSPYLLTRKGTTYNCSYLYQFKIRLSSNTPVHILYTSSNRISIDLDVNDRIDWRYVGVTSIRRHRGGTSLACHTLGHV